MHSDSIFIIGESHKVCEDYALHKDTEAGSLAIVCDGCSGSENTDVGARLLAHAAAVNEEPEKALFRAYVTADSLRLNELCLDATLLRIFHSTELGITQANMIGDGYIVHKTQDKLIITEQTAPNGFPFYLSYQLDKRRKQLYLNTNGMPTIKVTTMKEVEDEILCCQEYKLGNSLMPLPISTLLESHTIAVFSDGVASFTDKNGELIEPLIVIRKLMNFKNYTGNFVQRKMNAALKKFTKQGWSHQDDISMAAIYRGERP
jgi:hypothetical protein